MNAYYVGSWNLGISEGEACRQEPAHYYRFEVPFLGYRFVSFCPLGDRIEMGLERRTGQPALCEIVAHQQRLSGRASVYTVSWL